MKNTLLREALETIQFQSNSFGRELESIVQEIRNENLNLKQIDESVLKTKLSKCIKDNTGIKITIVFNDSGLNANIYPIFNLGHIFLSDAETEASSNLSKKFIDKIRSQKEHFTVDIKTGKVGSFFGDIDNIIFLSYIKFLMNPKFTIREVVSILLHEVGHGWTALEYTSRLVRTNQALASIAKEVFEPNEPTKTKFKLKLYCDYLDEKSDSLDELINVTNNEVICTVIIDKFIKNKKSELGTAYYDSVSCEYLADQYAARYGYALDLVTALQKLSSLLNGSKDMRSYVTARILEINILMSLMAITTTTLGIGGLLVFVILGLNYIKESSKTEIRVYDKLKVRSKRIKEQLIQNLKDRTIDTSKTNELLTSFESINKAIDSMFEYESIIEKLALFISSRKRDEKAAMQLQRDLEELASNSLFVKSAQLRTMTI